MKFKPSRADETCRGALAAYRRVQPGPVKPTNRHRRRLPGVIERFPGDDAGDCHRVVTESRGGKGGQAFPGHLLVLALINDPR
jgi:hypothetical protein